MCKSICVPHYTPSGWHVEGLYVCCHCPGMWRRTQRSSCGIILALGSCGVVEGDCFVFMSMVTSIHCVCQQFLLLYAVLMSWLASSLCSTWRRRPRIGVLQCVPTRYSRGGGGWFRLLREGVLVWLSLSAMFASCCGRLRLLRYLIFYVCVAMW